MRVAEAGDVGLVVRPPPKHRPHPGQQLAGGEGLGQVVVRARVQPRHPVLHGVPGREHQAGRGDALAPDALQRVDAAELRHHPVEDQAVVDPALGVVHGVRAVLHRVHGVARVFQQRLDRLAEVPVVVGKQYPHRSHPQCRFFIYNHYNTPAQAPPGEAAFAPVREGNQKAPFMSAWGCMPGAF